MFKPFYSPTSYLFSYLSTYVETYFLQNWLPRWNQILTHLRFIHNWVSNNKHPMDCSNVLRCFEWTEIGYWWVIRGVMCKVRWKPLRCSFSLLITSSAEIKLFFIFVTKKFKNLLLVPILKTKIRVLQELDCQVLAADLNVQKLKNWQSLDTLA